MGNELELNTQALILLLEEMLTSDLTKDKKKYETAAAENLTKLET